MPTPCYTVIVTDSWATSHDALGFFQLLFFFTSIPQHQRVSFAVFLDCVWADSWVPSGCYCYLLLNYHFNVACTLIVHIHIYEWIVHIHHIHIYDVFYILWVVFSPQSLSIFPTGAIICSPPLVFHLCRIVSLLLSYILYTSPSLISSLPDHLFV